MSRRRVWRAPSPEDTRDAIKVDLTASSRSSIRRRSHRSPVVPGARRARRSANAHAAPATNPYARSPRRSDFGSLLGLDIQTLTDADAISRRHHDLTPLPPVPESRNYTRDARERAQASRARTAREYYGYRYHDAPPHYFGMSEERESLPPRPRAYDRGGLPPYTPNFAPAAYNSSPDYFPPMPPVARSRSPPADGWFTRQLPRDGPSRSTLAAATARSSHVDSDDEADRLRSDNSRSLHPHEAREHFRRLRDRDAALILARTSSSSDSDEDDANPVGFPPLRRMGRRTVADGPLPSSSLRESWSPVSTVDGLGDRERSFSPEVSHWDTMLTTVAPDPRLPSADSSFTSAAASASFSNPSTRSASSNSNSNSASSGRTHLTVPSTTSPSLLGRVCESSDEDEDTDMSDDDSLAPAHISSTAPARNPARYSRALRDRVDDTVHSVRNFYSFGPPRGSRNHATTNTSPPPAPAPLGVLDGPLLSPEPRADDAADRDTDFGYSLEHFRGILRELVSRDDVSPEFWASAGLRLERLEREHARVVRLEREHARLSEGLARARERL